MWFYCQLSLIKCYPSLWQQAPRSWSWRYDMTWKRYLWLFCLSHRWPGRTRKHLKEPINSVFLNFRAMFMTICPLSETTLRLDHKMNCITVHSAGRKRVIHEDQAFYLSSNFNSCQQRAQGDIQFSLFLFLRGLWTASLEHHFTVY